MTKIVWDSNSGWDIVGYIGKSNVLEGFIRIILLTGRVAGKEIEVPEHEIRPYEDLVIEEMKFKYKYDQTVQLQN